MRSQVVVRAQAEVDYDNVALQRLEIEQAARNADTVVLDLSGTQFMSSAGVAALVEAHRWLDNRHKRLAVVAPVETNVRRLLDLASLGGLVTILEHVPVDGLQRRAQ